MERQYHGPESRMIALLRASEGIRRIPDHRRKHVFVNAGSPIQTPEKLIRATDDDKKRRLDELALFQRHHSEMLPMALHSLQQSALGVGNVFEVLMETAKVATLGQITAALYQVGGKYRRNM